MAYYCQQCLLALNVKESSVISCLAKVTNLNKEASFARQEFGPNYLSEPEWRKRYPGVNPFPSLHREAQNGTKQWIK